MKHRYRIWIFVLITSSILWVVFRPKTIPVETAFVDRGAIVETLTCDGYFRSLDRRVLSSFADGEVEEILLKPGDPVKKAQTLTRIRWDVNPEALKSPLNGVVSKVWRETAGPVRRGEPLIEVIDPDRLEVVTEILTSDASRIRPGQKATVVGFGLSTPLRAKVKRLNRAAFVKVSALGVDEERTEVLLEPLDPLSDLAPWTGNLFHAEVTIETSRVERALKIPIGALIRTENDWSVYVVENHRARQLGVARGIDDGHWVEVLEGLTGSERLILYPENRIRNGIRIKLVETAKKPQFSR